MACLANAAACAELPRAQVTANAGDRRTRLVTSSVSGTAISLACRSTAADASRNSAAVPEPNGFILPDVWCAEELTPPGPARERENPRDRPHPTTRRRSDLSNAIWFLHSATV